MSDDPVLDRSFPPASAGAVAALAPSGTLRAGINLSNFLLVSTTLDDGTPVGVSPDMARSLAAALGVDVELRTYPSPGGVADDAANDSWDIGNIGAEPKRAVHIDFTDAYAEIPCTLLVPGGNNAATLADLDQPGRRIAVKARAAYALWLERNLEHAELCEADSHDAAFERFRDEGLDALAGLRPKMEAEAARFDGGRVLDEGFSSVQQAIGTPKGRDTSGFDYLRTFVAHAKSSGLVADLIAHHGAHGLLPATS